VRTSKKLTNLIFSLTGPARTPRYTTLCVALGMSGVKKNIHLESIAKNFKFPDSTDS